MANSNKNYSGFFLNGIFFKVVIICITLYLQNVNLFAQKIHYENFKIKDGLPSNTIYDLLEDKNGLLWIATNKGISVYDGVVFKNYTTDDGLADNDVIDLLEDSAGRMWFIHFSTGPSYFYKGKFYGPHNDTFLRKVHQSKEQNKLILYAVNVDNGNVYFKIRKNNNYVLESIVDNKSNRLDIGTYIGNNGIGVMFLKINEDNTILLSTRSCLYHSHNKKTEKNFQKYYEFFGYKKDDNKIIGNGRDTNRLCFYNFNNNEIEYLPIEVTGIPYFSNDHNLLYVLAPNKIVIIDKNCNKINKIIPLDFDANGLVIMKNGDIFCKSNISGLFLIKKNASLNIFEGTNSSKNALSLFAFQSKFYIGTDGNGVYVIQNNYKTRLDNDNLALLRIIGVKVFNNKLYIGADHGLFIKEGNNWKDCKIGSVKDIESEKNELFIATANGVYHIVDRKHEQIKTLIIGRATSVFRKDSSTIWYGMLKGLGQISLSNGTYKASKIKTNTLIDESYIIDIKRDINGNMWIASNQNGLFFYSKNTGFIAIKSQVSSMKFNICKKIFIDFDNTVWVAHSNGLAKIQCQWKSRNFNYNVLNYNKLNGLPENDVNDVLRVNNQLIVASESGAFIFSPSIKDKFDSKTILSEVQVNGKILDPRNLNLTYKENNIKFKFSASFINSGGTNYKFKYRIIGISSKWETITTNELLLYDLKPGNYRIDIAALDISGSTGPIYAKRFNISQPWYKSAWFVGLCSLLGLFLLYLFYRYKKKQIENRKNLIEMELKVLRGQMKPHFIFNSLNSIQQNLLLKDFETTSNYITKFSKLLRNNLHYSALEKINLTEEVDFLNNYLELEVYRFHNLFTYNFEFINIDNKEDIKLPAFMIQPVLENCIKHGFKFTKEGGKINLIFEQHSETLLKVTILDNGVGLNSSFKIQKSTKPDDSVGLSTILQRINLFKLEHKSKAINFTINNNPNREGTIAILYLPITTN